MDTSSLFGSSGGNDGNRKTFISHVFSTTDEGKAELLNAFQYGLLGVVPVFLLNKMINNIVPEPSEDKSSIEIVVEIVLQMVVMFAGIIFIHRMVTFVPTYSEFKYESLSLTSVVLVFFVIMLSIQTKFGIKASIMYDRMLEMWNGPPVERGRKKGRDSSSAAGSGYVSVAESIIPSVGGGGGQARAPTEPRPASSGGIFGAW